MQREAEWSDLSAGKENQIVGDRKVGERHGTGSCSEPPKGSKSPNTLILVFWPPNCERTKLLCFKSLRFGSLLGQPEEMNTSILLENHQS